MNFAAKSDTGVRTTTASVIRGLIVSIKIIVPAMVATPVNSCEKPIKRPSENVSISEITLLIISP